MFMRWLSKAPTSVVITMILTVGLVSVVIIGAFVWLSLAGIDTTELRQWIVSIGVPAIGALLGVNTAATISAARSASNAEDQTNGHLEAKDIIITSQAATIASLRRQLTGNARTYPQDPQ